MTQTAGLRLLRDNPAYRAYFAARTTSVAGGAVAPIALAFAVLQFGGGATGLSIVLSVEYVVWIALMPAMGLVADRSLNLRALLIVSQLAAAACQATEAVLIFTRAGRVWSLALVAACGAGAAALSGLAGNRLLAQIVPPGQLAGANALFRGAQMSVAAAGPALAGLLVSAVGPGWGIAWDAVSFLAAAGWFSRLPRLTATSARAAPKGGGLAEGWAAFHRRRWLLILVAAESASGAAFMSAFILGPVYAKQSLGGPAAWGLINTGLAAGSALGAMAAGRLRLHRPGLIIPVSATAFALGPAAIGAGAPLPVVLTAISVGAALAGPGDIARRTLLQVKIPNHELGRVDATTQVITGAPTPLAYLAAGRAADAAGAQTVIGACAVIMVIAGLGPLLSRQVRRVDLTPDTKVTAPPEARRRRPDRARRDLP